MVKTIAEQCEINLRKLNEGVTSVGRSYSGNKEIVQYFTVPGLPDHWNAGEEKQPNLVRIYTRKSLTGMVLCSGNMSTAEMMGGQVIIGTKMRIGFSRSEGATALPMPGEWDYRHLAAELGNAVDKRMIKVHTAGLSRLREVRPDLFLEDLTFLMEQPGEHIKRWRAATFIDEAQRRGALVMAWIADGMPEAVTVHA